MIAACGDAGAQTLVGTPDDVTGIDGLLVDGTTYNVTFYNGTFAGAFPTGPNFTTFNSAFDAADILGNTLNGFAATGIDGFGCGSPPTSSFCTSVFIPFSVDTAGISRSFVVNGLLNVQFGSGSSQEVEWSIYDLSPVESDPSGPAFSESFWGIFTPTGTSVPEPTTLGLLVLGLAGVGFASRKSKI